MKTRYLRQCIHRYGTPGLLLVGAYLLLCHLWMKKRLALLACLVALLTGVHTYNYVVYRSVTQGSHRLYLGRDSAAAHQPRQPLEHRLLGYWEEEQKTEKVRGLVKEFARSVEQQDRVRALSIGDRLCALFRPWKIGNLTRDGAWYLRAALGEIYLEEMWLEEAKNAFLSVLNAIPPGEPLWGRSIAREMASYGLARVCALWGFYEGALKLLARAPGEYNGGCGTANAAEAVRNYPKEVVWAIARKPFPTAVTELQAIMGGRFTPMENWLFRDTSEEQRQHAAAEAALTLGCLYYQARKRAEAEACWSLLASHADSQHEATLLARATLDRLPRD